MRRLAVLLASGFVLATGPAANAQILYDNASSLPNLISPIGIVTDPVGFPGGLPLSALTAPDNVLGFGFQAAAGNRLADDFTVPAGQTWTITGLHGFGYTTTAGGQTAPTVTFGVAQFFNAQPVAGSIPIAGDATTNIFTSAVMTDIRRAATPFTNADRRVVDATLTLGTPLVLTSGTYWVDFGFTGINFSPPLTVSPAAGSQVTGNALQFTAGAYSPLLDALGGNTQRGVAFQLVGSVVPEPTSIALVGIGAIGLGLRRWRKK